MLFTINIWYSQFLLLLLHRFLIRIGFMVDNIVSLNEYVQTVEHTNCYWMVRTMGGDYFDEFVQNGFIAIGYDEIPLREIRAINLEDGVAVSQLKRRVSELYDEAARPGHIVSQLLRFCKSIAIGDIVVLPGHASYSLAICRVTGDPYEDVNAIGECRFTKRIPIEVLRKTTRLSLPPKAQFMFNSRHPISDITPYAQYIDNTMLDFYNKNNETHIVLRINTDDDVSVSTFYAIEQLFQLTEGFCKEQGINGSSSEVVMKVQMESKGALHFISSNKAFLALVGLGILFINGGGLKISHGSFNLDLSTHGLFGNYNEYMDRRADRALLGSIKNSLDSLAIETPDDFQKAVIELYQKHNDAREKY